MKSHHLFYSSLADLGFIAHADATYSDVWNGKLSITYVFAVQGAAVDWQCKTLPFVTYSTTEAELGTIDPAI